MRIGTRASALALAQAGQVAELLGGGELVPVTTSGDRGASAGEALDKSRWVLELEQALRDGTVDIAVHSAKDVPVAPAAGLTLFGTPRRASAADALCGSGSLDSLDSGARIGTSSLRRRAQLLAEREDLDVVHLRGNVDTRLQKLDDGEDGVSAIVLASAGLQRLGLSGRIAATLDPERFVPAPGQGTLAIEGRDGDEAARTAVVRISDESTFACLRAERALARGLGASCDTPLGAYATIGNGGGGSHGGAEDGAGGNSGAGGDGATVRMIELRGWVGLPDGSAWLRDQLTGDASDPEALGLAMAERMLAAGAGELLRRAEEMAGVGG